MSDKITLTNLIKKKYTDEVIKEIARKDSSFIAKSIQIILTLEEKKIEIESLIKKTNNEMGLVSKLVQLGNKHYTLKSRLDYLILQKKNVNSEIMEYKTNLTKRIDKTIDVISYISKIICEEENEKQDPIIEEQ